MNVKLILGVAAPNLHICREVDSCLRMRELMHVIKDKLGMFNKTKMDIQYEKKDIIKKKFIVQIRISKSI